LAQVWHAWSCAAGNFVELSCVLYGVPRDEVIVVIVLIC